MRTIAQKRAEYALQKTLETKRLIDSEKLKSFSAGAPSMILQNGFGQTIAFWLAKGKAEHMALFRILTEWLKSTDSRNFGNCQQPADYVQRLAAMEQGDYLRCQSETLALLEWVKRFANADML
ncbi:MAG: type III-B CRISPR module-associated protein Cmr5 [Smithella sp.]